MALFTPTPIQSIPVNTEDVPMGFSEQKGTFSEPKGLFSEGKKNRQYIAGQMEAQAEADRQNILNNWMMSRIPEAMGARAQRNRPAPNLPENSPSLTQQMGILPRGYGMP